MKKKKNLYKFILFSFICFSLFILFQDAKKSAQSRNYTEIKQSLKSSIVSDKKQIKNHQSKDNTSPKEEVNEPYFEERMMGILEEDSTTVQEEVIFCDENTNLITDSIDVMLQSSSDTKFKDIRFVNSLLTKFFQDHIKRDAFSHKLKSMILPIANNEKMTDDLATYIQESTLLYGSFCRGDLEKDFIELFFQKINNNQLGLNKFETNANIILYIESNLQAGDFSQANLKFSRASIEMILDSLSTIPEIGHLSEIQDQLSILDLKSRNFKLGRDPAASTASRSLKKEVNFYNSQRIEYLKVIAKIRSKIEEIGIRETLKDYQ